MNNFSLLQSYIKLGFRNIGRNWVTSLINIFGLSIALSMAITVFIFVDFAVNLDEFHSKKDRIFQVTNFVKQDGGEFIWADSPYKLGDQIKLDFPQIEAIVRFEFDNANVRSRDEVFTESITYVDPSFLDIFDFELMAGSKSALKSKNQIVISKDFAIKYFSGKDPLGQPLEFKISDELRIYTVGAVLAEYPKTAGFGYDVYVPISNFESLYPENTGWGYMTDATFVLLDKGSSSDLLEEQFNKYVAVQNGVDPEWEIKSFKFFNITELSENNHIIRSTLVGGSHPAGRIAMSIIAGILLLLACFNYTNIQIASATKRLKEIAIRKVMGSYRVQIVFQFLVENLLLSLIALLIGTFLAWSFLLPGFSNIVDWEIPFVFSSPITIVLFFLILILTTGVLAGSYPAFFVSKISSLDIMRGNKGLSQKNIFSKILLGFQFCLSFITIVAAFLFTENAIYMQNKDWGYNPKDVFSLQVQSKAQAEQLENLLEKNPGVVQTTVSRGHVGRYNPVMNLDYLDTKIRAVSYAVDDKYSSVLGLKMLEGRWFTESEADLQKNIIINEKFVEKAGWENALNKQITIDSVKKTVIGVVKDFRYSHFFDELDAVVFTGLSEGANFITIKTKTDQQIVVNDFTKENWYSISPNDPYESEFQENVLDYFFVENRANIVIMMVISFVAIILSSLGLYGLISFNIQRRLKEFSIRKVLGASPKTIIRIVSNQYLPVIIIAFLVGAPVGYYFIDQLETSVYPEKAEHGILPFLLTIGIVLFTVVVTVSGQIKHAITVNPSDNLRNE